MLRLHNEIIVNTPNNKGTENGEPEWLRLVRQHVNSLRFGTVLITVHDSRVTQVEISEKVRLDNQASIKNRVN
jgi:hypothetical protein